MQITVYQLVQIVLLGIILVYLIYYVYTVLFDKKYQPKTWQHAVKNGSISAELRKRELRYPDKVRFFNFWFQVQRLKKEGVEGSFAELGVYKGDSAHLLHLMDPERSFHLFDTFEGFQEKDLQNETGKAATYTTKNFADTSLEKVKARLGSKAFHFHKGDFPDTTASLHEERFALVNMDADLYNPTREGLAFFYPRLSPGGIIIIHDYNPEWPGIIKAVDDFAATIPEPIIVMPDQDSSVMIFKSKQAGYL
jgi:O-methyltransferase